MSTFLYFAYGSNMLSSRLLERCPSATKVGLALAQGWRLSFSKRSTDGSGKATLIASTEIDAVVHGVLFEISSNERGELDKHEGAGYLRHDDFGIVRLDGRVPAFAATYLAIEPVATIKPYDWYLRLILAGGIENGINSKYLEDLERNPFEVDLCENRPTRKAAIKALCQTGNARPEDLLPFLAKAKNEPPRAGDEVI